MTSHASRSNPRRILLLGTHGQHNIGDELLLETFLHELGDDHDYVINTYDRADTAARLGDRYLYTLIDTARDRWSLLRHLWTSELVVFAGGSILKELSAATRRPRYATLLMIWAVVLGARLAGRTPIAMLNIGVGPLRTRRGRLLARLILASVSFVTVRDAASLEMCRRIGAARRVRPSTDAVFGVSPRWLRGGDDDRVDGSGPWRIALNLNHDVEAPELWDAAMRALSEALTVLAAERSIELHLLPMQSRGKEHDDATVLRAFARSLPGVPVVEHAPEDHRDVASIISSCDVVVAERLHALITASKLGIPVVPLIYDTKVREISHQIGAVDRAVDLSVPFSADAVLGPLRRIAAAPRETREQQQSAVDRLTVRAQQDFGRVRAWISARTA
ncbi:polysaccharide pyruvyl transferase family protein [Microbacterium sp. ABRD28]|uniref:polysaccharide pyruvyl transferase family protein n=1 Tax=Microbacterium sp. ABRD28 TaxID=2268461 RepID=UPI000F54C8A2|nr:polysaccharide pyruvyl transferase family protein [Microbacterium sp. ABRD28]AZC14429.1 hypothetical protein DT073_12595 [Microbacterium sp. ABRD28]